MTYTPPITQQVARGKAKLYHSFRYEWDDQRITIPAGYVFNGASIPRLFWSIVGVAEFGPMDGPAAVHDYIYERKGNLGVIWEYHDGKDWKPMARKMKRKEADRLMKRIMEDSGFFDQWRYDLFYKAVDLFGKAEWDD